MNLLTRPWIWLAVQGLALWPVWHWVIARCTDGTSEGWGLASWLAAALIVSRAPRELPHGRPASLDVAATLTIAYALVFAFAPPIVSAALALTAVTALSSSLTLGQRFSPPLWCLLLLGLPIEASLQFYIGYPLRVLATELSAGMLQGLGLGVTTQGTQLVWGGLQVAVDAPCSGIATLRMGLISCSALLLMRNSGSVACAGALVLTALLAVAGNALRSASLFLLEGRILGTAEAWADIVHAAAGSVVFAGVLYAQWWVILYRAQERSPSTSRAA